MKTSVGALILLGAVMTAGLTLAQTSPPQRGAPAAPAAGPACTPDSAGGARRSGGAGTPVNGVGGQGGGRYTFTRGRVINNSETDNSATPDRAGETSNRDHIDQDAQADIRTGRSAPANPTAPAAGGLATGNTYTTGDFAGPEMRRAGDPRGPGADSAAPACEPAPPVRR